MALTKKTIPTVKDPELRYIIQRIYDNINEIIDAINNTALTVAKREDNKYIVQVKSPDGTVQTADTTFTPETKEN